MSGEVAIKSRLQKKYFTHLLDSSENYLSLQSVWENLHHFLGTKAL